MCPTDERKRYDSIQVLRAVAVLLVVGRHILVFLSGLKTPTGRGGDALLIGDGGVDVFFVISGFVMVITTHRRHSHGRDTAKGFAYARVSRIYPLYWCYTFGLIFVIVVAPNLLTRFREGGHTNVVKSLLLLPQGALPVVGQGWSLIHEMYFYTVFTLLLLLVTRWRFPLIALWGALILAANLPSGGLAQRRPIPNIILHPLTLEFVAGAFVAFALVRWGPRMKRAGPAIVIATAGVGVLIFESVMSATRWHHMPEGFDRIVKYGGPGLLLVAGLATLEHVNGATPLRRPLKRVGDVSYSIYLSHILVVAGIAKITPDLHVGALNIALGLVICVAAVAVGELSYRLVEAPLLEITRRWAPPRPVHAQS